MSDNTPPINGDFSKPLHKTGDGTGLRKGGTFDQRGNYHSGQLPRRGKVKGHKLTP